MDWRDKIQMLGRPEDAKGKTITGVSYGGDSLAFGFTDGTALLIEGQVDYDDSVELSVGLKLDALDACDCGLITNDEWRAIYEEEKRQEAEMKAAEDRKQYEELKAKFEPKEPKS